MTQLLFELYQLPFESVHHFVYSLEVIIGSFLCGQNLVVHGKFYFDHLVRPIRLRMLIKKNDVAMHDAIEESVQL